MKNIIKSTNSYNAVTYKRDNTFYINIALLHQGLFDLMVFKRFYAKLIPISGFKNKITISNTSKASYWKSTGGFLSQGTVDEANIVSIYLENTLNQQGNLDNSADVDLAAANSYVTPAADGVNFLKAML